MRQLGLLVAASVLAACAMGGATTPASTTTVPTTTTTAAPIDALSGAAMFRGCLSGAGYEIAEIPIGEDGRLDLSGLAQSSPTDQLFRRAVTACSAVLSGFLALEGSPGVAALVRDQLVRFAQCMRASGVEEFPDPSLDFAGTSPPFPPELIPVGDPDFNLAVESCASAMSVSP